MRSRAIFISILFFSAIHAQRPCEIISVWRGKTKPFKTQEFEYDNSGSYCKRINWYSDGKMYETSKLKYVNEVLVGQKSINYGYLFGKRSAWKEYTDKDGNIIRLRWSGFRKTETSKTVFGRKGESIKYVRLFNEEERNWYEAKTFMRQYENGAFFSYREGDSGRRMEIRNVLSQTTSVQVSFRQITVDPKEVGVNLLLESFIQKGDTSIQTRVLFPLFNIYGRMPAVNKVIKWKNDRGEEGRLLEQNGNVVSGEFTRVSNEENRRTTLNYLVQLGGPTVRWEQAINKTVCNKKITELLNDSGQILVRAEYSTSGENRWYMNFVEYYKYCE